MIELNNSLTRLRHRSPVGIPIVVGLLSIGLISGCASGLWDPVQPWDGRSWVGDQQQPTAAADATGTGVHSTVNREVGSEANQPQPAIIWENAGQPINVSTGDNSTPIIPEPAMSDQTTFYRSQNPQDSSAAQIPTTADTNSRLQQTAAQFSEPGSSVPNGGTQESRYPYPTIDVDGFNNANSLLNPTIGPGNSTPFPQNYADLDIYLSETETGRINIGGAFNSDSGLVGQFVIDERNFDITRMPRNFREIVDGTAWRGGGQNFRLELIPGNEVERYLVSFSEPFLFNTAISFSSSLFYFQRQFFDYDEERLGGRFSFGYRLTPDLSVSTGLRLENVDITDPRVLTSPELNAALGESDLYVGNVSLIRDTRDHPFLPTEGNFMSATYSQGFGEFDFPRGDIDFRTYRLIYQRPDLSGRHTLSYGTRLGFTGSQTPLYENYFAGGFSSLRGFDFRGASPIEGGVRVGGEFQWLNTVEYMFPLTADDMIRGVLFTDFGTVEESIEINSDNFRVAPGFGFRVHLPAAGIGAPLAFDFAFPVAEADGDDKEVFSFYIGATR